MNAIDEKLEEFILQRNEILRHIREVREVFENYFDRTWFSVVIDGVPIDLRTVREIRMLVSMKSIYPGDEREIFQGVRELEHFCNCVKRFLLPIIKERLRVSRLFPNQIVRDKHQYILRRFVAYTFPYNLERLAFLTGKLKNTLILSYPFLV